MLNGPLPNCAPGSNIVTSKYPFLRQASPLRPRRRQLAPLVTYVEASRQWSLDQYNGAQRAFEHIKNDSFDKWDESRLRAFLLEQELSPLGLSRAACPPCQAQVPRIHRRSPLQFFSSAMA
ncbi:hypothetical protein J3R82DRAFT_1741 [Butyriboletus roseoflavus]|nr:hypothetical protein J3R82DRAFT_1741 [Butyriboletus roseoflavus]